MVRFGRKNARVKQVARRTREINREKGSGKLFGG